MKDGVQSPLSAKATPAGTAKITPIAKPVLASASDRPRRSGGDKRLTVAAPTLMNTGSAAPWMIRTAIMTMKSGSSRAARSPAAKRSKAPMRIQRGDTRAVASVKGGPNSDADSAKAPTSRPVLSIETWKSRLRTGSRPTTMNSVATTTALAAMRTSSARGSSRALGMLERVTRWRRHRR